ncbi:MAG: NIPSNAP family protein [Pseudomonadota bacterium]
MITCHITYKIDPNKIAEFEVYSKAWIALVPKFGGTHHGYFLPHEGPNDLAYAAFSFPSLAAYETYRKEILKDPDCVAAFDYARKTGCIIRYDRYFLRPVLEGDVSGVR